jgi:hypothetical protein
MKAPFIPSPIWCFLSVLVTFSVSSALPLVDLSYTTEPSHWFPLVNGISNAYHLWRIDPLLSAILSLGGETSASDGVPLSISMLTIGTGLLARRIRPALRHTPATLWIGAALSTLAVALTVGRDSVVFGTLAWVPLFSIVLGAGITAARRGMVSAAALLWIVLLFTAVQGSYSANQLSLLSTLFSLLIALSLTEHEPATSKRAPLGYCLLFILGFIPALYTTATAPIAPFPDYPTFAHLVPDDGIPGLVQPNVGAEYPVATVHRVKLKETFAPWSIVLLVVNIFILVAFGARAENSTIVLFSVTGTALAATLLVDTLLPERLSLIAPLLSTSRSIPSAALLGLTPVATGACIWSTSLAALLCASGVGLFAIASYLFISSCALFLQFQSSLAGALPGSDFLDRIRAATITTPALRPILISPSLHAVRDFDPILSSVTKPLENLRLLTVAPTTPITPTSALFESFPPSPSEKLAPLIDGSLSSRWNLRSGGQRPGDTLQIRLQPPTKLAGLELETGDFPSDYPRGLLVKVTSHCDDKDTEGAIFFSPHWQGSLRFTPTGFPFFSGQESVRVLLPETILAGCITITQTGESSTFDWSIAEIGLITPQLSVTATP